MNAQAGQPRIEVHIDRPTPIRTDTVPQKTRTCHGNGMLSEPAGSERQGDEPGQRDRLQITTGLWLHGMQNAQDPRPQPVSHPAQGIQRA
ncbi:hypothetical protein SDC9_177965 [bioreactor metagenome]|uniref:Uncharacterized protein n=1 Tax=bioreactor metagenome TaxID=1076179 RepID=A0A645H2C0_9ZZZZ